MFEDVSGLITHDYGFRFSRKTKAYNTASVVYVLVRVSRVRAPVQMDGRCRHLFTDGCGDADSPLQTDGRCQECEDGCPRPCHAPRWPAGPRLTRRSAGRVVARWRWGRRSRPAPPCRRAAAQRARRAAPTARRAAHGPVGHTRHSAAISGNQPQSAAISEHSVTPCGNQ